MSGTQCFCWTDQAKTDLCSFANAVDQSKNMNWLSIEEKFKNKYPHFKGTTRALKNQYQRCKTEKNGFLWCDKAKTDFSNITKAAQDSKSGKISWLTVLKEFQKIYPNFEGTKESLRMQYRHNIVHSLREFNIESPEKEKEKTQFCDQTNYDLIDIMDNEDDKNVDLCDTENNLRDLHIQRERQANMLRTQELFIWNKTKFMELTRLVNYINVDGYPNWNRVWYAFIKNHEDYKGSKFDLKRDYEALHNNDDTNLASMPEKEIDWNEIMDLLLAESFGRAQCVRSAQIRDGRKISTGNLSIMTVNTFKGLYKKRMNVEYTGAYFIILKHYYDYKASLVPCTYICEEASDSVCNIYSKKLQGYASKNHTLAFTKIFNECCHNCGTLFSRTKNNMTHKRLTNAINGLPEVTKMKLNIPYIYYTDEKYITCIECIKNPNWVKDYSVSIGSEMFCNIPKELRNLSEYEQNQVALCGGFYSLYKKQNIHCKIFEHRQKESNIGMKRDTDYQSMFISFYNVDRLYKSDSSSDNIKTALLWLKRSNRLYKQFLSNYETIYGYLMSIRNMRPEERIIQITKGSLEDLVGRDKMGLLIPADNVKIGGTISAERHKFGIQHPLQENLNTIREIIQVNYSDPDLEAKRWPHLFPLGDGSWKKNSSLKQQTYVKKRLLGIDSRFRRVNEFMFFWYDRLTKERLLYYNNRGRIVNVNDLSKPIQVKDVRSNENRYGTVVPSSISGSRTYWNARKYDLLAIVRDFGKPDIFVTLTQNDNWLELQEACGQITAQELKILDHPIMQPAIGGKSVVQFPVENVVAFHKRLDMFMKSCIHNKNGPFREVIDFWFRIEYQNRGALHCHMLLWICEETIPETVVMAQIPRYSGSNINIRNQTFQAREYVKTFQVHTCKIGGCCQDNKYRCKYGFPYDIQLSDEIYESKMGYKYMRHSDEDKNVVPFNLYALLCWNGHLNVQKVTSNGIEAYLCKYVSKPERSIDIKDMNSDADKFLKPRVVGILECCAHLLQFHQARSSRKVVFLPCDFQPARRMLKRKSHLPQDIESEDIYYQSLLYKYLIRPVELQNLTYIDMYRFYDVVNANTRVIHTQEVELEQTQDESEHEIQQKCDETQQDFSCKVCKIKSQRKSYVWSGYKYVERGKAAVPRWRFLLPFGNESEKYYEQRLLLNIPINEEELDNEGYPFSVGNQSKTFIEECCIRNLVDSEETAKSALMGAIQRGFSVDRVIELATMFVYQSFVTTEYVDYVIIPWSETMPDMKNLQGQADDQYGEELTKMMHGRKKFEPYHTFLDSMTESQKNVMSWVENKLRQEDQILAILSGGAGVGKSYITRALYSYFVERKMVCVLVATTGSAAHLISGTTLHYYLIADIHGNNYLQPGTISAKIIEDTEVIIVDEFSMLSADLLDQLNDCTKEYGQSHVAPFGGKHLFLIGDPCQLPAIGKSVFSNPLLNMFSILLLKETVRQKNEEFAELLNRVRLNMMTEADKSVLRSRYKTKSNIKCDDSTLIVTATRGKMHQYNNQFISQLPGQEVVILAQDFESDTNKQVSSTVKEKIQKYVKNLWDERLVIKEGCIVRLLRNLDVPSGWVNSKRAKVFRLPNDGSYVVLQDIEDASKQLPLTKIRQSFKLGAHLYYRLQYPLVLGYSTTVHAIQGTTVTGNLYVDLDRSFWETGQAFVALSRPKELSQLFLLNTHFEKVLLKPYYKELLTWMSEVDEISLVRKQKYAGDFPLLPFEQSKQAKMQVFPSSVVRGSDLPKKNNPQFKAPRVVSNKDDLLVLEVENNKETDEGILPEVQNELDLPMDETFLPPNPRLYRYAEAFNNAGKRSAQLVEKLRFGAKFMNELLEYLNSIFLAYQIPLYVLIVEKRLVQQH